MQKINGDRLFLDLGANIGESLFLYSKLFAQSTESIDVICVEPTNDVDSLDKLTKNINELSKIYKSIKFLNVAVSSNSELLCFYDGLNGSGFSLITKLITFIFYRRRLVKAINILDLLPSKSDIKIDIKLDILGSEYELIDYLYENYNNKINSLYIKVNGLKAGFTHLNDINIIEKARVISENVYSWDLESANISKISNIFFSDLVKKRLIHIQTLIFNNKFKRLDDLFIDKFLSLPFLNKRFHCRKRQSRESLYISNALSLNDNKYEFSNTPEKKLIKSSLSINLLEDNVTSNCYYNLLDLVNNNIKNDFKNHRYCSYRIAFNNDKKLLTSNQVSILKNEVYRFVINPLIVFPEIIDLLISPCFKNLFQFDYKDLRLAGINLRYSSPSESEKHTMAFHRDYNSYYTVKLFIPLSKSSYPFLEFFPDTELLNTGQIHYTPRHIKESLLPKNIRKMKKIYSSIDLSNLKFIPSTCIHRELPSPESKITLIVTYLSHPDYGYKMFKARRDDVSNKFIDNWTEDHLSFIELI